MTKIMTEKRLKQAQELIEDFSQRTGLTDAGGDPADRYLWTDAFAVQSLFGLSRRLRNETYKERAFKLIDLVHQYLGRHHPQDSRVGWISGLPEEEAEKHPTKAGLRIGKEMPEREKGRQHYKREEWSRDGQYFHYNTRWISALMEAHRESGEERYASWAAELMLAQEKFIYKHGNQPCMYWKMSTDLSRPLVTSMGAHDPLEGMILALSLEQAVPSMAEELEPLIGKFSALCGSQNWTTSDSLGIGGLLLNTRKAVALEKSGVELPDTVKSQKLIEESKESLEQFKKVFIPQQKAEQRLAFRECGLSLGLRVISASEEKASEFEEYMVLADKIEDFWSNEENQRASSWKDHLNINEIALASSLIAGKAAAVFSAE